MATEPMADCDRAGSPRSAEDNEEEETWIETRVNDLLDLWDTFRYFMYNPRTGRIMGRTRKSCGQISLFFLIFYSCLAAFFAICFSVFLTTVPELEEGPKYTNIIGKPGSRVAAEVVTYTFGATNARANINNANTALLRSSRYDPNNASSIASVFSGSAAACRPPNYGTDSKPCIIFTINRVVGWLPNPRVEMLCTLQSASNREQSLKDRDLGGDSQFTLFPSGGFTASAGHFPYIAGNSSYRQPIGIIMFNFTRARAEVESSDSSVPARTLAGKLSCVDRFDHLSTDFKITLTLVGTRKS